MKTSGNTVLIIGGSTGIGFEIAKILSENNNEVIVTGRSESKLRKAVSQLKNVSAIVSDFTKITDVKKLIEKVEIEFPNVNILINNAAVAFLYNLLDESSGAFEKAQDEIYTNYLCVLRITGRLLPLLKKQAEAAIVNVSSVAAFLPDSLVGYSASKAALHSFSRSLRLTLESTNIRVFELMPPLVNTEFSKEIGGSKGISPRQVAEEFFNALKNDEYEIQVGKTSELYQLYLSSQLDALERKKNLRRQLQVK
jgi:uncharacterized oxidoreductase